MSELQITPGGHAGRADGAAAVRGLMKKTNEGQSIIPQSQTKQQVRGGQLIRQFAQAAQHGPFEWISGASHNVKSKACTRG